MCKKKTRETGEGESGIGLCIECLYKAGVENEHSDGYHKNEPDESCPLCVAEGRFK
jgi:hypothetical protein